MRDEVEELMMRRLLDTSKSCYEVDERTFHHLLNNLMPKMELLASKWHIPGFTDEDLISFFTLRLHQWMTQHVYDDRKWTRGLFTVMFNNLANDLQRRVRARSGIDALDNFVSELAMVNRESHIYPFTEDDTEETLLERLKRLQ